MKKDYEIDNEVKRQNKNFPQRLHTSTLNKLILSARYNQQERMHQMLYEHCFSKLVNEQEVCTYV